ncbi:hypothetical protein C0992_006361 [Termitomyces sp. T32_za158]|nr:hypothetical protein C0992_006361 [Termitomyces sp. T32_za158]
MQRFRKTNHNDPAPVLPVNEYNKERMLSEEAQWNDTFQESLRDFQLKFEEEETARSAGERGRLDEFHRTMTNFHDIFLENHRRRQQMYEKNDAFREDKFQKADAEREAIFVRGQQDRARAYETEQEMREKRVEWYSTTRRESFSDGRQRLAEKCNGLHAALVEQFNRLLERQKEAGEVAEEQSNDQDAHIPVFPDGSSGPSSLNPQWMTSLPPSSRSPSFHSRPRAQDDSPLQSTYTEYDDQQDTRIYQSPSPSPSPSPSMRSLLRASSSPDLESLNSLTEPTSLDSNDQQEEGGSPQLDGVEEDNFEPYFMRSQKRRQDTFLQHESKRTHRFNASEATRNAEESKRSTKFDKKMKQWSKKSQVEQIRGREEERFNREIRRSTAFLEAENRHILAFEMSMMDIMGQAYAEDDLEESHFRHQEDMLLKLYERQAIQLNQRTEDQIVWFKFMRDTDFPFTWRRKPRLSGLGLVGAGRTPTIGFAPAAIFEGPIIQKALPTPKAKPCIVVLKIFEHSQELRAQTFQKGAKERHYTFTINEAKREAEFVKVQQKRKELFDKAEDLREYEFEKAQNQRRSEFRANERKREKDFDKNEAERNDRARKAQKTRAQDFQSIMSRLQQQFIHDEEERLKELELLGEELIMSREQAMPLSLEKFPRRSLNRSRTLSGDEKTLLRFDD